jgi:[ribosomal protein S5]-alanine N-acetyltransferase
MLLELDEIRVRSLRPQDAESLARYANNVNIAKQLRDRFPHPYSLEDAHQFLRTQNAEPERNFAIAYRSGPADEAIGVIGFVLATDIDRVSAEIGYWLGEPFWGKGYCTAVLRSVTEYGFDTFSLTRIFATPRADNAASCRVLEKAGYTREAILRRAAIKQGEVLDMALYAKIRP